jgi:hypothetical protein
MAKHGQHFTPRSLRPRFKFLPPIAGPGPAAAGVLARLGGANTSRTHSTAGSSSNKPRAWWPRGKA